MLILGGCSITEVTDKNIGGHHIDGGFRNYPVAPSSKQGSLFFYIRRIFNSFYLPAVTNGHALSAELARRKFESADKNGSITWLGHSTFLIQLNGKIILTDPFLTDIAGPNHIVGSRRYVPPGIALNDLPLIDIIIVSHDHYDHLDSDTIDALRKKASISVFVPLGLKNYFQERGYSKIYEMDWQESENIGGIEIHALPSVHDSGRLWQTKKNSTLWASWAIRAGSRSIYFAGDTAYSSEIFKAIGEKYGGFDLALLPIGAYTPKAMLSVSHVNPEEAIKIAYEIGAGVVVGMHWGTIQLSDTPIFEPPRRFRLAARKRKFCDKKVWIMKIGETRNLIDLGEPTPCD